MATPVVDVIDTIVSEADGYVDFVIRLSAAYTGPITVIYATADGSANGNDYAATGTSTLSFAPGETVKTIRVALADDIYAEGTDSFYLNLLSATNATLGRSQAVASIVDDDADRGTPVISVADAIVDEKAGRAYITLTLDKPSATAVSVTVATADGSARAGTDYLTLPAQTVGFAPGQTSKTIVVSLIDDTAVDLAEDFSVVLSTPSGATLADNRATVAIAASDLPAPSALTASVADVVTDETRGYAEFIVSLSGPLTQTVTLTYASADGSANGNDYAATGTRTLSFAPGETVKTIRVALADDTYAEGTDSFYLNLLSTSVGALGKSQAVASIVDDDANRGTPSISVSDAIVDEKDGRAVVTLTLDKPSVGAVTVNVAIAPGSALAGSDYQAQPSHTVGFAPGETTKTIVVSLIDDTDIGLEPSESFGVVLSLPDGATLSDSRAVVTIGASGPAKADTPVVSVSDIVASEGQGYAEFIVELSHPYGQALAFRYLTSDGLANGNDYAATGVRTLTFAPGDTVKTVRVALVDDAAAEGAEDFHLGVFDATQAVLLDQASAYIVDQSYLSVGNVRADESAGSVTFVVQRTGSLEGAVTVSCTTGDGSAMAGSDYTTVSRSLTFAPGEFQKTVSVALVNDAVAEVTQGFTFTLGGVSGAQVADGYAVATIADDDVVVGTPATSIADLAMFARAAYALRDDEPRTHRLTAVGNDFRNDESPTADSALIALRHAGWQFLGAADLPAAGEAPATSPDGRFHPGISDGIFTNGNAAAVVAVSGQTLVVSFRGTNDARYADPGLLSKVIGDTPDKADWIGKDEHWALFEPLVAAVNSYIYAHGITQVLVTGHSLGASMVQPFLDAHPDTAPVHYLGMTFATPGYGANSLSDDQRVTNFWVDNDSIQLATWADATDGDENQWRLSVNWPATPPVDAGSELHSMDLYLHVATRLRDLGLDVSSFRSFGGAGTDTDDMYMAVNATLQSNSPSDSRDDTYLFTAPPGCSLVVPTDANTRPSFLAGTDGTDVLTAGSSADALFGGPGNDVLTGGAGDDWLDGGAGSDTASYASATVGVVITLATGGAQNTRGGGTDTFISIEYLTGSPYIDSLTGNGVANRLSGLGGNDTLTGLGGNDTLNGGSGVDSLVGSSGSDSLTGGAGNDVFLLDSKAGSDSISDFLSGFDHVSISMAKLKVGDGDTIVERTATRGAPGGFLNASELVIFTDPVSTVTSKIEAAAAIGSASSAYAVGQTALFAVNDGTSTGLYLFTSADTDAIVSAGELALLATINDPTMIRTDFLFGP